MLMVFSRIETPGPEASRLSFNSVPSKYNPTVSLYKFQFPPTAAFSAVYIGSTSTRGIIGALDFTGFWDCDDDIGRGFEDITGLAEPRGMVSKLRRVVIVADALDS
jgi:hypothetical protein